jgi:L-threonylcarbamoyladenylate synthase
MVLPKKNIIPDIVTSGLETLAVRVPDHPLTLRLLEGIDFPLAAPSANPFGYVSPTSAVHVNDQLGEKIPYILDGGDCRVGIESTIVRFDRDKAVILRLGGIAVEDIESVIGKVTIKLYSTANPAGPGMLESHYAPMSTVMLGNIRDLADRYGLEGTGMLLFNAPAEGVKDSLQYILSPNSDLEEAATRLFSGLRHLDQLNLHRIFCEPVPDVGLGKAINDRLRRASFNKK